jgi:hypothetical protein
VPALLTPAVHAALVDWHNARGDERRSGTKNSLEFWVTDESVILRVATAVFTSHVGYVPIAPEELLADIRATAGLAKLLSASAPGVAASTQLAPHAAAWRAFAAAHGFPFSESPLRTAGTFDGVAFTARAASLDTAAAPGPYGVELTMPFSRPLPFYLRLGPRARWYQVAKRWAAYPDAWAEWVGAEKTGDAAFDHAYRVVTADSAAQKALLTADVRRALLELLLVHEHVHVTGDCISVRTSAMVAPETFAQVLRPLAAAEKLIDKALSR